MVVCRGAKDIVVVNLVIGGVTCDDVCCLRSDMLSKSGRVNLESYGHWRGTRTAFPSCGVPMFSAVAVIKVVPCYAGRVMFGCC